MLKGSKTIFAVIGILPLIESCGNPQDGAAETQAYGGVNQRVATPAASGAASTAVLTDETADALRKDGGHGAFEPTKNPTARLFYNTAGTSTQDATCTGVLLQKPANSSKYFVLTQRWCLNRGPSSPEIPNQNMVQTVGFAGSSHRYRVEKAYRIPYAPNVGINVNEAGALAILELEATNSTAAGSRELLGRFGMNLSHPNSSVDKFSAFGFGNTKKNGQTDTGKLVRVDAPGLASVSHGVGLTFNSGSGLAWGDEGAPVFALKYGPEETRLNTSSPITDDMAVSSTRQTRRVRGTVYRDITFKPIIEFKLVGIATQVLHDRARPYFAYQPPTVTDPLKSPVLWANSVMQKVVAGSSLSGVAEVITIPTLADVVEPLPSQVADWPTSSDQNGTTQNAVDFCSPNVVSTMGSATGTAMKVGMGVDYDRAAKTYVNVGEDRDVLKFCIPQGKSLRLRMSKGGEDGLPLLAETSAMRIGESASNGGFARTREVRSFPSDSTSTGKAFTLAGSHTEQRIVYVGISGSSRGELYLLMNLEDALPTLSNLRISQTEVSYSIDRSAGACLKFVTDMGVSITLNGDPSPSDTYRCAGRLFNGYSLNTTIPRARFDALAGAASYMVCVHDTRGEAFDRCSNRVFPLYRDNTWTCNNGNCTTNGGL